MRHFIALLITVIGAANSTTATELLDVPDMDSFGWQVFDEMGSSDMSLWDVQSYRAQVSRASWTSPGGLYSRAYNTILTESGSGCYGKLIPELSEKVYGIRADLEYGFGYSTNQNSYNRSVLGVEVFPDSYFYFGLFDIGGTLKGTIASEENGQLTLYEGSFDVSANTRYNLAIAFDEDENTMWLYKDNQCLGYAIINPSGASFDPFIESYSHYTRSWLSIDNVEVATIPEPATLVLISLGAVISRKRQHFV